MEVIYPTSEIIAKQKNQLETLLTPFSIMSKIMFAGQKCLDHQKQSCKWVSGAHCLIRCENTQVLIILIITSYFKGQNFMLI